MAKSGSGPRQPGGGRQIAGPRGHDRGGIDGKRVGVKRDHRPGRFGASPLPAQEGGERGPRRLAIARSPKQQGRDKDAAPPIAPRSARTDRPLPRGDKASGTEQREVWGHPGASEREASASRSDPASGEGEAQIAQEARSVVGVQTVTVTPDEAGMRVDRFFEGRFPGLSFSHIQRIIRKGEVRVNGKRIEPKDRLEAGQTVRIPPLKLDAPKPARADGEDDKTRDFLKTILLYEDADVLVLNKPMGLAVQGGSGTTRHIDGMLESMRDRQGQRPRLVHRLDKDTAGCLLVAKTRFAAAALAKSFRSRAARKVYWALVAGVPKPAQGRISTFLAKEEREEDSFMRIAAHGEKGAIHAVTYYALIETAGRKLTWLSLKPVTGRTHQLRAHVAYIGHPIVGDPKYFSKENWELPGGMQNRLHLLARRIVVPHPRGGVIDVTAPLPPHMVQSFNLLGFDPKRYDPIEDAPQE